MLTVLGSRGSRLDEETGRKSTRNLKAIVLTEWRSLASAEINRLLLITFAP
jgi:hypothetical protein